jgi:hypothetical protein
MLAGKEVLPAHYDTFSRLYIAPDKTKLINREKLGNRILGMVSHVDPLRPSEPVSRSDTNPGKQSKILPPRADGGFPEDLGTEVVRVEMGPDQYRQYLEARDFEERATKGSGGRGPSSPSLTEAKRSLALPSAESEGGSTYYVQSRQLGNYALPLEYLGTKVEREEIVLDAIPDEAFTAESGPKLARTVELVDESPGPVLVYSEFVGKGGLGALERYLLLGGFTEWRADKSRVDESRGGVRRGAGVPHTRVDEARADDRESVSDFFGGYESIPNIVGKYDLLREASLPPDAVNFSKSTPEYSGTVSVLDRPPDYVPAAIQELADVGPWAMFSIVNQGTNKLSPDQAKKLRARNARNTQELLEKALAHEPSLRISLEDCAVEIPLLRRMGFRRVATVEDAPGSVWHLFYSPTTGGAEKDALQEKEKHFPQGKRYAKRYALIKGGMTEEEREAVKEAFNSPENKDGSVIKALLISRAGAEGLDLKWIRTVIEIEPYWDKTREAQVKTRAIRQGSHDGLPTADREVKTYLLLAAPNADVYENMKTREDQTTDERFHERALQRDMLNRDARALLREVCLECSVNEYGDCRACVPTDARLFTDDPDRDIRLPDPCREVEEESAEFGVEQHVTFEGTEYLFSEQKAQGKNGRRTFEFYRFRDDLDAWVPVPLYDRAIPHLTKLVNSKLTARDAK